MLKIDTPSMLKYSGINGVITSSIARRNVKEMWSFQDIDENMDVHTSPLVFILSLIYKQMSIRIPWLLLYQTVGHWIDHGIELPLFHGRKRHCMPEPSRHRLFVENRTGVQSFLDRDDLNFHPFLTQSGYRIQKLDVFKFVRHARQWWSFSFEIIRHICFLVGLVNLDYQGLSKLPFDHSH